MLQRQRSVWYFRTKKARRHQKKKKKKTLSKKISLCFWKNRIMRIQGSSKQRGLQATLEKKKEYRWRFTFKPRMRKTWQDKNMEVLKSPFRLNKTGSWIGFLNRNYKKKLYWGVLKQNRRKLILLTSPSDSSETLGELHHTICTSWVF